MKPLSIHIKDILDSDEGLGLKFGRDLFISKEPNDPAQCVTIYDTGGRPPLVSLGNQQYRYEAIQIRVRAVKYEDGFALAEAIYGAIEISNKQVDDSFICNIVPMNTPYCLGWSEDQRCIFIINYETQRR